MKMPFEDWEGDQKTSIIKWIIFGLILLLVCSGSAVAIYRIVSPPSDPVVVTTPATLSKPTVSATSAVVGDTITITTQLSDGLAGVQVFFYENSSTNPLGSDYTNDLGQASYNKTFTSAGTYTFYADCVHP